jgi:hypothetical protein
MVRRLTITNYRSIIKYFFDKTSVGLQSCRVCSCCAAAAVERRSWGSSPTGSWAGRRQIGAARSATYWRASGWKLSDETFWNALSRCRTTANRRKLFQTTSFIRFARNTTDTPAVCSRELTSLQRIVKREAKITAPAQAVECAHAATQPRSHAARCCNNHLTMPVAVLRRDSCGTVNLTRS